jgi:hypothetical protein
MGGRYERERRNGGEQQTLHVRQVT